jgi:NtrC-family two-component system sensor histidine kinase KinB
MKIKAKLRLGIGILFFMIALLIVISSVSINRLSNDTKNILVDNYNTLDYSRQMLSALNKDIRKPENKLIFENNLQLQKKNITEPGEDLLTNKLYEDFEQLISNPSDSILQHVIQTDITDIMLLNMQAIKRKNSIASDTASKANLWIAIAGCICFIVAFTLFVNLPGNIANPVKELTESIKAIAAENYSQQVHFKNHNEFGELARAFNTMAEKLQEYKTSNLEKLMMEKKRIETLINNMSDPVIGLDENNQVLFMNDVALRIAGLSNTAVAGKKIQDIAVTNDLIRSLIHELFSDVQNKINVPVKIYANNKESYFEKQMIPINIIPTGEETEKKIGNVIVLKNITPFKELDFAKTNFIATVSHELKTPIASIQMGLQLLRNNKTGELNKEQTLLVAGIAEDSDRLLKITGELLNMAQVETGNIQLKMEPCDPAEMISFAVNANKILAAQKKITLETSLLPGIFPVLADSEKTTWILTNLISNAIRYSYENSRILINARAENENKLCITVSDTGQGIAPEYLAKIFDRYYRIPGSKKEGTGLGLAISKELIEAQNGSISVESDYGSGSTFSIFLNRA